MKAALYVRVSTQEQAIEGYSLDAQTEKLTNYSNYQKYDIVKVYRDEGFSGASMARPALTELLNAVRSGLVDVVIIYKLDRLSRRVRDILELLDDFEKKNVILFSITENIDVSSPFGRAALKMSATFSELERETIIERCKLGKEQRVKQGKMMCSGVAPFGYLHTKDSFEIIPREAEIVKKIFELYLQGYSIRKLFEYAQANFNHPYFNNPMCCRSILHRAMYGGYFSYKNELYKGKNFEPIISFETYLSAQKKLLENTSRRERDNTPYLLTGLVVCSRCGNKFVGKTYKDTRQNKKGEVIKYCVSRYGCSARLKFDKLYHHEKCNNTIIKASELDSLVEAQVKNLKFTKFDGDEIQYGYIDSLMTEQENAQKQIDKLLDLYLSNIIDKKTFQQRTYTLEKSIQKNKMAIQVEKERVSLIPNYDIKEIQSQIDNYSSLTKKEKRFLLKKIIEYIAIDGEKIVIKWRYK